jgi:subtilase family serine protease
MIYAYKSALGLKPHVISMSFGIQDNAANATYVNSFNSALQLGAANGSINCASSGDYFRIVTSPSSSAYGISVGGTYLKVDQSGARISEQVWYEPTSVATGEGYGTSAVIAKPSWQKSLTTSRRYTPDISATASPLSGLAICCKDYTGSASTPWVVIGGTSLACPIMASVILQVIEARISKKKALFNITQLQTRLYDLVGTNKINYSTCVHDVTAIQNTTTANLVGYDLYSGLGAPKCSGLMDYLINF